MNARIIIPRGYVRLRARTQLKRGDFNFCYQWHEMKPPHWELIEAGNGCLASSYGIYIRPIKNTKTK